jgi:hypothetical protein
VVDPEGSAVAVNIVGALSPSANAAEVLSYTISGVPANATFNHGTNAGGGVWTFTAAQLTGLTITVAEGPATLNLTVTATSTVTAGVGGATAGEIAAAPANTATSTGVPLVVVVDVQVVDPTATISNTSPVDEGSPFTVTLSNPFSPSAPATAAGFHYNFALLPGNLLNSYSASSTSNSATFTIDQYGTYTVWGQIIDRDGAFTNYSTTVTILAIAHAPSIAAITPLSEVTGYASGPFTIAAAPSPAADPNEVLSYAITGVPTTASFNQGTNEGGGVWSFTAVQLTGLTITSTTGPATLNLTVSVSSTVNPSIPADLKDPARLMATTTTPLQVVSTPETIYAVGAGPGGGPLVHVYNPSGDLIGSFYAYDPSFRGGVTVAVGDINGDGIPDIITGTGPGGGPNVKVFSGLNFEQIASFMAINPDFRGGINVAVGDVNGDGKNDIITGAGSSGGPQVTVYSGSNFALIRNFFAYSSSFRGGVNVAAAVIGANTYADIITGSGNGGGPQVKVFDGKSLSVVNSFFAYESSFQGGVYVAAGDLNGDGNTEIVTGPGLGGPPSLVEFNAMTGTVMNTVTPFGPDFETGLPLTGGLTVAVEGEYSPKGPVVLAGSGPNFNSVVTVLTAKTLLPLNQILPYTSPEGVDFTGGVFVG